METDQHKGRSSGPHPSAACRLVRPASPPCSSRSLAEQQEGRALGGRGGHAARPVPAGVTCPRVSRARVATNRGAALSWERGGCGERRTETGDVFKPGPGGITGGCSGDEDNDSDGHAEALVPGVKPPALALPRVRAGEGGVATGKEEGGARFRACPRRLRGDPLSSALLPFPRPRAR